MTLRAPVCEALGSTHENPAITAFEQPGRSPRAAGATRRSPRQPELGLPPDAHRSVIDRGRWVSAELPDYCDLDGV